MSDSEMMTKFLEFMQRLQSSYRARMRFGSEADGKEAAMIVDVLGDCIRYAATLRAGDGIREKIKDEKEV